jgi:hypothetical protein
MDDFMQTAVETNLKLDNAKRTRYPNVLIHAQQQERVLIVSVLGVPSLDCSVDKDRYKQTFNC